MRPRARHAKNLGQATKTENRPKLICSTKKIPTMRSSVNPRSAAVALMAFSICTATVHAQQHAIIGETVSLPSGELQGVPVMGGKVVQFLGVPFAQPPVGDLRWRAPLREKPWSGTLQANHIKAACMQGNPWYPQPVSEDW